MLNEYDKTNEAKEIYKLLVNSDPSSMTGFNARVNQAHTAMWESKGSFDLAINLYTQALELQPDNLEVSLYLSKALFRNKDFDKSRELLCKKLHMHPNDLRIKFNLASVLYRSAQETFNLQENHRSVAVTKKAIEDLTAAKALFLQLLQLHSEFNG